MNYFVLDLKEEYGLKGGVVRSYITQKSWSVVENWRRPAVIVVPGGGYSNVSERESECVAVEFLARGFHAFVLNYTVGGENGMSYPEQLIELGATVDYVRKHAEELTVNPDEIFVVGFSAGGHLTGNLAVDYQNVSALANMPLDCKPTAVGLCYPVITEEGHKGSFRNLLYGYSDEEKAELTKKLELHTQVTETTPPAFVWTTAEDTSVPPAKNALPYVMALAEKGVDYELHIYPRLAHGRSTGHLDINPVNGNENDYKRITAWMDDCASFFRMYIQEKF